MAAPVVFVVVWFGLFFNDFFDAAGAGFHDHQPVIDNRIPLARLYVILGGHFVQCQAFFRQDRADTQLFAEPERRMVLALDEFVEPGPFLSAKELGVRGGGQASGEEYSKCKQGLFHGCSGWWLWYRP
jgi:hypothetical protein